MRWFFLLAISLFCVTSSSGWGFWAHKRINRMAVFTLPSEMMGFYKKHLAFIEENAVMPDKRRYTVKDEAPRHYIDLDHYAGIPFDSIPRVWNRAVEKYSEDSLLAHGIVPWYIHLELYALTEAFRKRNAEQILYYSANIAHYIADAHVPLHTTSNYNGQKTGQHGIHGLWESRLPELFASEYDYLAGRAYYLENTLKAGWSIIRQSHAESDTVLGIEKGLQDSLSRDQRYAFEDKGGRTVRVYSQDYCARYHALLNGMVERKLRASILLVGCFWYTAWVNAGQPDLNSIQSGPIALPEEDEEGGHEAIKGHTD